MSMVHLCEFSNAIATISRLMYAKGHLASRELALYSSVAVVVRDAQRSPRQLHLGVVVAHPVARLPSGTVQPLPVQIHRKLLSKRLSFNFVMVRKTNANTNANTMRRTVAKRVRLPSGPYQNTRATKQN